MPLYPVPAEINCVLHVPLLVAADRGTFLFISFGVTAPEDFLTLIP